MTYEPSKADSMLEQNLSAKVHQEQLAKKRMNSAKSHHNQTLSII